MSLIRRSPAGDLTELLARLPEDFVVGAVGASAGAQFVAGPPGAYVIAPHSRIRGGHLPDLDRLASLLRAKLAERLTLVPFIQPLLVSSGREEAADEPVTSLNQPPVVPLDLLLEVLVEGRPILDPATITRLDELVLAGDLASVGPHP